MFPKVSAVVGEFDQVLRLLFFAARFRAKARMEHSPSRGCPPSIIISPCSLGFCWDAFCNSFTHIIVIIFCTAVVSIACGRRPHVFYCVSRACRAKASEDILFVFMHSAAACSMHSPFPRSRRPPRVPRTRRPLSSFVVNWPMPICCQEPGDMIEVRLSGRGEADSSRHPSVEITVVPLSVLTTSVSPRLSVVAAWRRLKVRNFTQRSLSRDPDVKHCLLKQAKD